MDLVPLTCPPGDNEYKLVRVGFYPATFDNTQRIRNYWGGAKLVGTAPDYYNTFATNLVEGGEILGERDGTYTGSASTVRNFGGLLSGLYTDVLFNTDKLAEFGDPLLTELLTNWTQQYGDGGYKINMCVEAYRDFTQMQQASTAFGQLDLLTAHGGWPVQLGLNEVNDPLVGGSFGPSPANAGVYFCNVANATYEDKMTELFWPTNPIPNTVQPFPLSKLKVFMDIFGNFLTSPSVQIALDGENLNCLLDHSNTVDNDTREEYPLARASFDVTTPVCSKRVGSPRQDSCGV
jgi:hypothetical protein